MAQNNAAAAGRKPKKPKQSSTSGMSRALVRRETFSAYMFLLPSLVFFVLFVVIPMFICVFYSLFNYSLGGINGFVGLDNYIRLFQDPVFHRGLINTIIIVVVAVPTVTAFSLWVGSAIYKMKAFSRSFFRCVFYLPVVTGSVAITVVWKWILDPYNGILNQLIGTDGYNWLGESRTALACIILILFTTSIGQPIVLYVAALGNVDNSIIEAARVDGSSAFNTFLKIILPIALPGLVATIIYAFLQNWNEYMFASVLMSADEKKTITYAISTMADAYKIQWNYLMCAAMISSVPTLTVFVVMQKYLIAGMTAGAVKE